MMNFYYYAHIEINQRGFDNAYSASRSEPTSMQGLGICLILWVFEHGLNVNIVLVLATFKTNRVLQKSRLHL